MRSVSIKRAYVTAMPHLTFGWLLTVGYLANFLTGLCYSLTTIGVTGLFFQFCVEFKRAASVSSLSVRPRLSRPVISFRFQIPWRSSRLPTHLENA